MFGEKDPFNLLNQFTLNAIKNCKFRFFDDSLDNLLTNNYQKKYPTWKISRIIEQIDNILSDKTGGKDDLTELSKIFNQYTILREN